MEEQTKPENRKCPKCGSEDMREEDNLPGTNFLSGGLFYERTFGTNYKCNRCEPEVDEELERLKKIRDYVVAKSKAGKAYATPYCNEARKKLIFATKKGLSSAIPRIKDCLDRLAEKCSGNQ